MTEDSSDKTSIISLRLNLTDLGARDARDPALVEGSAGASSTLRVPFVPPALFFFLRPPNFHTGHLTVTL